MTGEGIPLVGLDQVEAVELSEILDHLALWLSHAPAPVAESLDRHIGQPGWRFELRDELLRWSHLLVTRGPTP
jgi:hypothetical protein